ncbi:MAG: hypothetical protein EB068_06550, partial [Betaproteobacteria bacterium]|nr:hypothetical protein [Betaproteobacteria bacterium]
MGALRKRESREDFIFIWKSESVQPRTVHEKEATLMSAEVMNKNPDEPRLLVIGGGTMGLDIAAVFLHAGWIVEIVEPLTANYEKKRERLSESLATLGGS